MLSCDANSAYKLKDADHLVEFDAFDLLMIEQPLWHDDFYYHSMLQKRLKTPICLDESIRNRRDALAAIEMESCKIINIKLGRVGGFSEAIAVHNAAQERGIPVWCGGMLEAGIGRSHNIALSSLENFSLPGDVSASARYWREDIVEPEMTVSPQARLRFRIRRGAATRCDGPGGAADGAQGRDSGVRTCRLEDSKESNCVPFALNP
jgi:O-succinylbenzoate synthase